MSAQTSAPVQPLSDQVTAASSRKDQLEHDLQKAQQALNSAQTALLDGSAAAGAVVSAQGQVTALESAVQAATERLGQLSEREAAEKRAMRRQAAIDAAVSAADGATVHSEQLFTSLAEAEAYLQPLLAQVKAAKDGWAADRVRFFSAMNTLAPGIRKIDRSWFPSSLTDEQAAQVIACTELLNSLTSTRAACTPLTFEHADVSRVDGEHLREKAAKLSPLQLALFELAFGKVTYVKGW